MGAPTRLTLSRKLLAPRGTPTDLADYASELPANPARSSGRPKRNPRNVMW